MTSGDDDNDARYNLNYNSEPCSVKNLRMNKLRFPKQDKSESRFQSGNMTPQNMLLAPPVKPEFRRSRFGSTQILYEESSNSTDEGSGMGKGSGIMQTENYKNNIEVVPLEQESRHNSQQDVPLKDIDESSISLDDCAMLENSHPSQMYFDRDEVLDECLEVLSQNAPKEDFDHFGDAI